MSAKSTPLTPELADNDMVVRFRPYIMALLLVLICLAAHMISFWNSFVLNDHFVIPIFRDILKQEWPKYWTELVTQAVIQPYAEPLLRASLALDYQSAGLSTALYHASNVLLHMFAVLSAFTLLWRLVPHFDAAINKTQNNRLVTGSSLLPFVACAIFACHPLTSDTVAYISGRSTILTFIFYTAALHCFITGFLGQTVRSGLFGYLFCIFSILFSILSSCQAITIPETMIVLGLLIKPASEKLKDWVYERAYEFGIVVFVALALPFTFLLPQTMPVGHGLGMPMMPAAAFYATQLKEFLTYYLRAFVVPVPLSIYPPFAVAQSFADPLVLAGLAALLGSVYLLLHYARGKDPYCFFGLWIFLIGLLPQSLIVTNEYVSGQRFYLSCFGLSIFSARLLINWVESKLQAKNIDDRNLALEPAFIAPLLAILVLFTGLSNYRDHGWSTDSAVLRGALRQAVIDKDLDKNGYIRATLALMLVLDGGKDLERGVIEAKRALEINLELPLAYLAMARHAANTEDFEGAKYYAERSLALAEKQKLSPRLLGLADGALLIAKTRLRQFEDPEKLKDMAREAIKVEPTNSKLYLALAQVYLSEHKTESGNFAIKYLGHARRLDINDINNLAPMVEAILAAGNPNNFEAAYGHALTLHKISPTTGSLQLLARAALETGRINKGLSLMDDIGVRQGGNYDATSLYILYGLCKQSGDTPMARAKAQEFLSRAKRFDPNIETNCKLWMRVKPLTPIQEARDKAAESGQTLLEKHPPSPETKPENEKPPSNH